MSLVLDKEMLGSARLRMTFPKANLGNYLLTHVWENLWSSGERSLEGSSREGGMNRSLCFRIHMFTKAVSAVRGGASFCH